MSWDSEFDNEAIRVLNLICLKSNALVVLSTAWSHHYTTKQLKKKIGEETNFDPDRIIGSLFGPSYEKNEVNTKKAINSYLMENDVDSYVVLDDYATMYGPHTSRAISPVTGLTEDDGELVLGLLMNPDAERDWNIRIKLK